ncbi:MAG TPA: FkbM family methyltransferase [Gemmataceae bacterium]|nr:FkbM family methyltransferase [Gemmataceae bacterium]
MAATATMTETPKPRTYPLFVHQLCRLLVHAAPRFPKVWKLRHHLLNLESVRFPDRLVQTSLLRSAKIWVEPNDLIGRYIFYQGVWEGPTTKHFIEGLRPGDTVLDVGANIGQYSVLAGQKVGPQGQVFAVEPAALARDMLQRNLDLNQLRNVTILPFAAWDSDTILYLSSGAAGNSGAAEVSCAAAPADSGAIAIPARQLGPALREAGCERIDVIKIDIEGAELPALRGLEEFFVRQPPRSVYCELCGNQNRFGKSAIDLLNFFDRFGYRPWVFSDDGLRPLNRDEIGPDTLVNLFLEQSGSHP